MSLIPEEIGRSVRFLKAAGVYPVSRVMEEGHKPETIVDGHKVLLFSSNSFLGLNTHPYVIESAIAATKKYGTGAGNSRLLAGTYDIHLEAEAKLAAFKGEEAAIFFSAGFLTNVGVIPALTNIFTLEPNYQTPVAHIFSDELNHASIITGIQLSKAACSVYKHCDVNDLEEKLKSAPLDSMKLVVTDSVFSLDGDIAPLPKIVDLADKYGATVMIDEAHSTGVMGERGRGIAEHFNIEGRIPVTMGTFSKALAAVGGFVVGSQELIDYLRVSSRAYIFSAALPPSVAATVKACLDVLEREPQLLTRLWRNQKLMSSGLKEAGFNTLNSESPIIPVLIGDEMMAAKFSEMLLGKGIFVSSVRWPAVPKGMARLRITVSSLHEEVHINQLIETCIEIRRTLKL